MLFLISEGIRVTDLYVRDAGSFDSLNRIPDGLIDTFGSDCEVSLLTEPKPVEYEKKMTTRELICFPASESDEA
jgi:hypothetical protein